jgi:apolipoprotein N-acyltransferase
MVTAFGLGMLAVLALPPLHIVPALFLAVPGLIAMIGGAASWTGAFWLGLAWGFGFFTGGLYWITSSRSSWLGTDFVSLESSAGSSTLL